MYGSAKLLKNVKDGLLSFRPILSAIGTPTYKLSKLVPKLEPLTTNEYNINDSFTFVEELQSFDSKIMMVSFDVKLLFTYSLFQEQIDFCVKYLFKDRTKVDVSSTLSMSYLLGPCLNY